MTRKQADVVFSLALFILAALSLWQAQAWSSRAKLFPVAIAIPMVALGVLQIILAVRNLRAETARAHAAIPASSTPEAAAPATAETLGGSEAVIAQAVAAAFGAGSLVEEEQNIPPAVVSARTKEMVGWIFAIAAGIGLLGFELGAALFSFLFLRFVAHESVRMSVGIALGTYLFFYLVFDLALNIPFPHGLIADLFGLSAFDHYLVDPIARFVQNR